MANAVWTRGLASAALFVALGSATPVLALEDGKGNMLDAFMGILGVGPDKDDEAIQYRDRPPLVVPRVLVEHLDIGGVIASALESLTAP